MLRAFCLLCLALVVAPACWGAQDSSQPAPRPPTNFDRVIAHPTGRNGYEELVMAGDLCNACAVWQAYERASADRQPTLAEKRAVVADPQVVKALTLLRAGLDKPVLSPRLTVDDETVFPELASFRSLARLLNVRLYVSLADGRMGEAIGWLRDGLRFGYKVQTDTLISGLVGVAMDAIVIRGFADHLDQLSAGDCDRLLAVAREWIAQPDPAIGMFAQERDLHLALLRKYRSQPEKLLDALLPGEAGSEDRRKFDEVAAALADRTSVGPVMDEMAAKITAYHARLAAEFRRPIWERTAPSLDSANPDTADKLLDLLGVGRVAPQVLNKYAADLAQVELLGVHAAIHRYLWDHNELPASLEDLSLGAMVVDPYSGKPLAYRRLEGRTYRLSSVGPESTSGDAPAGQRTPIELPYRKP